MDRFRTQIGPSKRLLGWSSAGVRGLLVLGQTYRHEAPLPNELLPQTRNEPHEVCIPAPSRIHNVRLRTRHPKKIEPHIRIMYIPSIGTPEASRTLVLAPTTSLANPRAWSSISAMNILGRYDEVHCSGGGSLLLFLMACAGKAPRLRPGGKVFFHGDIVYPTPESCKQWLSKDGSNTDDDLADAYEWRAAALSLGVGGGLHEPSNRWLEPIARSVTMGRWSTELVDAFNKLKTRTEEKGRLVCLEGQELVKELYNSEEEEEQQPARVLVRCGELECEQLDGDGCVTFRA